MNKLSNIILFSSAIFMVSASCFASTYSDVKSDIGTYRPDFITDTINAKAQGPGSNTYSPDSMYAESAEKSQSTRKNSIDEFIKSYGVNILSGTIPETTDNEKALNKLSDSPALPDFIAAAFSYAPGIRSAVANYDAVNTRYSQAAFLDQLSYQFRDFTESLKIQTGAQKHVEMAQMESPAPGMWSLKSKVIDGDMEIAELELETAYRDTAADVKTAYAEAIYFTQAEKIAKQNLSIVNDLEKVVTSLYESGIAQYQDLVKVSIMADQMATMKSTVKRKKEAALVKLIQTCGLPENTAIGALAEINIPELPAQDVLVATSLGDRQELNVMRKKLDRMDTMIAMSERRLFGDLSTGMSYYQNREILTNGTQAMMPSFQDKPMVAVPGQNFSSDNSYLEELKNKKAAMSEKIADMENMSETSVAMKLAAFNSFMDEIKTDEKTVLKKSDNAYEASLTAYTSGDGKFIDVADSHRRLLDIKLEYYAAKRDAIKSLAELEKVVGSNIVNKGGVSQ